MCVIVKLLREEFLWAKLCSSYVSVGKYKREWSKWGSWAAYAEKSVINPRSTTQQENNMKRNLTNLSTNYCNSFNTWTVSYESHRPLVFFLSEPHLMHHTFDHSCYSTDPFYILIWMCRLIGNEDNLHILALVLIYKA